MDWSRFFFDAFVNCGILSAGIAWGRGLPAWKMWACLVAWPFLLRETIFAPARG